MFTDEKWGNLKDGEVFELQWFDASNWDWPIANYRGGDLEGAMIKVAKWMRLRQLDPKRVPEDLWVIKNANLLTIEVVNGTK